MTLSDKRFQTTEEFFKEMGKVTYYQEDVKEFIKDLKDDFHSCIDMPQTTKEQIIAFEYVIEQINKRAGNKLI